LSIDYKFRMLEEHQFALRVNLSFIHVTKYLMKAY